MIHHAPEQPRLNAMDVIRGARKRLTISQGACSAGNPELLKASIDGLLEEIHVTNQVRAKINHELGILGAKLS